MGLDACVYFNREKFSDAIASGELAVEEETGEIYVVDHETSSFRDDDFKACEVWLGNTASIAELRDIIGAKLPADSIITSKIIYSGSHAGDYIELQLIGQLQQEIEHLRSLIKDHETLTEFLNEVSKLIDAAFEQKSAIVF